MLVWLLVVKTQEPLKPTNLKIAQVDSESKTRPGVNVEEQYKKQ